MGGLLGRGEHVGDPDVGTAASSSSSSSSPAAASGGSFVFAFAAGSEASGSDMLFVAMSATEGPLEEGPSDDVEHLRVSTLTAAGEIEPCAFARTRIVSDTQAADGAGGRKLRCAHRRDHIPQAEAVEAFCRGSVLLEILAKPPASAFALLRQLRGLAGEHPSTVHIFEGSQFLTGPKVWPGAVGLCNHLAGPLAQRARGASAIELGCGLGLPGVMALLCGAAAVALTDSGPDVEAVLAAALGAPLRGWRESGRLRYERLEWGTLEADAMIQGGGFDLILCGDCVYEPYFGEESWRLLAETIGALLAAAARRGAQPEPLAVVSVERRGEGLDGVDGFLEEIVARGLCLRRELPEPPQPDGERTGVEVYSVTCA